MADSAELFACAWQRHQAGQLAEAEKLYREVLQIDPARAEAWCFLGAVYQASGRLSEAEAHVRQALALVTDYTSALNCLGTILGQQGKWEEARLAFEQLLRAAPRDAEGWYNLGQVHFRQGRIDDAITCYQYALQINPDFTGARASLTAALQHKNAQAGAADTADEEKARACNREGLALAGQGRFEEAATAFAEVLRWNPLSIDGRINLGGVRYAQGRFADAIACFQQALEVSPNHPGAHYNLGAAYEKEHRLDEAATSYERALELDPRHTDAWSNLGNVRRARGDFDGALACFLQALQVNPNFAEIYTNIGNLFTEQGRFDEALDALHRSVALKPGYAVAHNDLGKTLADMGRFDEALVCYEEAIRLQPNYGDPHFNRALVHLLRGDLERGWPGYEWRWRKSDITPRSFTVPLWDGTPLRGRTILLHVEQGLGDTIQFLRYVPWVKKQGGTVLLQVQPSLLSLAATCSGIDQLFEWNKPVPAFDVHAPLLSLPGIFGTSIANIPADTPYLEADPDLVDAWRMELTQQQGFKVGVVWQGSPSHSKDRTRSARLAQFAPLATVPGVKLFALQVGSAREQLQTATFPVTDLGGRFNPTSLADLAAVLVNLDLLVCVDTAPAHLAGALGVRVWMAVAQVPDWRWLLGRDDSPWYRSMRLFRQQQAGDWDAVFVQMRDALGKLVAD